MPQSKPDIPGYRILRRLGQGGMSEIWLAEQIALARPVAVKVVSLGQEADARLARFRQEASLIARFDHPNVVGIIEFGDTGDGRLYFSMPYVPNGTLAEAGLRGDSERVREVIAQMLDALAYVHQHGVVHRDIKPENVLFDNVGRARLADFGVSRSMEGVSRHTRAGETFGSSYYLSPEQARGETLDGRSDLYSLGAVAFELLTGATPFQGPDDLSIVVAHLQAPVPRLPPELKQWQGWIDTALAKRPDHRFADAESMRSAMARIPTKAGGGWPSKARTRIVVAAVALIAVITLILVFRPFAGSENVAPGISPVGTDSSSALPTQAAAEQTGELMRSGDSAGTVADRPDSTVVPPTSVDPQAIVVPEAGRPDPSRIEPDRSPIGANINGAAETAPADGAAGTARIVAPDPAPRRRDDRAVAPARITPGAPAFAASFRSVPRIPLYLLAGTRGEQLERIDEHLDWGRRAIEADRADVEELRGNVEDRGLRKQLRDDYDTRKVNYETWRRQLLDLKKKVERSE